MLHEVHYRRRIDELETEVERLRQARTEDCRLSAPMAWHLTPKENIVAAKLATREMATIDALCLEADCAEDTLRVLVSRMRKKLSPAGYTIRNVRGRGYVVNDRARLKKEMQGGA